MDISCIRKADACCHCLTPIYIVYLAGTMSLGLAELDRKPSDGAERPEKRGPKLGDAASL